MSVKDIAEIILKDPVFVEEVKNSLDKILKDGKIDMADVPEMMLLVTSAYNKSKSFTVSYQELPELLTELSHMLIAKYDLVPDELRESFEKVLQSSITLIVMSPNVKSNCLSCFPFCK